MADPAKEWEAGQVSTTTAAPAAPAPTPAPVSAPAAEDPATEWDQTPAPQVAQAPERGSLIGASPYSQHGVPEFHPLATPAGAKIPQINGQTAGHVARYAKPDMLSGLSGNMSLDTELGENYKANDLAHNQMQSFKDLYHGAEAMVPGMLREGSNLLAQPPEGISETEKSAFHARKMQSLGKDLQLGGHLAMESFPPVYLAEKYGRPIAHGLLGHTIGESPDDQHAALKQLENDFVRNPLGVALDMLPAYGPLTDAGRGMLKGSAKMAAPVLKSAGTKAAELVPKKISDAASRAVANLKPYGGLFSPAALAKLAEEVANTRGDLRSMAAKIRKAYEKIPKNIRPYVMVALERTDPKYAHLLKDPAVRAYAELTDRYWKPIWQEMEQRGWVTDRDALTARWFPEWASKVYRGEIEPPLLSDGRTLDREHLSSVHIHDPAIEQAVDAFRHEQQAYEGVHNANLGRYQPIVYHGTLRKHFSGPIQAHVMAGPESMTIDEIQAMQAGVTAPRIQAKPQQQLVKGKAVTGIRNASQSMNSAEAHIYKLQTTATVLGFVRQAAKLTDKIHALPTEHQAGAALKLTKRLAPLLKEAGIDAGQVHEFQELATLIAKLGDEVRGGGKGFLQHNLIPPGRLKNWVERTNNIARRLTVAMNAIYPIKINLTNIAFFTLATDWNAKSIFHALLGLRLMAEPRLAAKIAHDFLLPEIESTAKNPLIKLWDGYIGTAHKGSNYLMRSWVAAKLLDEMSQLKPEARALTVKSLTRMFSLEAQARDFAQAVRASTGGFTKTELFAAGPIQAELATQAGRRYRYGRQIREHLKRAESHKQTMAGAQSLPAMLNKTDASHIKLLEEKLAKDRMDLHERIALQKQLAAAGRSRALRDAIDAKITKLQDAIEKGEARVTELKGKIQDSHNIRRALVGGTTRRYQYTAHGKRLTHYVQETKLGTFGKSVTHWNKLYDEMAKNTHEIFGDYGRALPPLLADLRGLDIWLFMRWHALTSTAYLWAHNPWKIVALSAAAQKTEEAHKQHAKETGLPNWAEKAGAWATMIPAEDHRIMAQFSGGWNLMAEPLRLVAAAAEIFHPERPAPGEYKERETRDLITEWAPLIDAPWTWLKGEDRGIYNPYVVTIGADTNGEGGKQYDVLALARKVRTYEPNGTHTDNWRNPDGTIKVDARRDTVNEPWDKPEWPLSDPGRLLTSLKKVTPHASTAVFWAELAGHYEHSPKTVPGVPGMAYPKLDWEKEDLATPPKMTPSVIPGFSSVTPMQIKGKSEKAERMELLAKSPAMMRHKQESDQQKLIKKVAAMLRIMDKLHGRGQLDLLPKY